jgi:hypothetical protein
VTARRVEGLTLYYYLGRFLRKLQNMFRISDLRSTAGPLAVIVLCAGFPVAPLFAKTKIGEKVVKQGRLAEARKEFDAALDFYEKALATRK